MEHQGTPIRFPASAFLLIDSADRIQDADRVKAIAEPLVALPDFSQPFNNFVIQKRQPFVAGFFTRLAVTELRFEYNIPNVNARNSKMRILIDDGNIDPNTWDEYTLSIPENFYTPDELAQAVEAELNSVIPAKTWTCEYLFQISAFRITQDDPDYRFVIAPFLYPNFNQRVRSLPYLMGFTAQNGYLFSSDVQYGTPFPPMVYTRYIDICSRQLTQYQKAKDNSTRDNQVPGVLLRLYLTGPALNVGVGDTTAEQIWVGCRPCIFHRLFPNPKYSYWSPDAFVDQIDIQLYDDAGNILYLPPSANPNIVFPSLAEQERISAIDCPSQFQLTVHCSET